eukprot:g25708.t2
MVSFTEKEIRMSFRKLLHYAKLMKRKQIQDAYEWVDSLSRMKSEPILKLIQKAMDEVKEKRGWDLARTYLWDPQPGFGFFVKSLRKHSRGRYGIIHSCRNRFTIRLRQMPLEEWFHWLYIYGKVPKTLSGDMSVRKCRGNGRPTFAAGAELKWLDSTRQFDYYKARQEFIDQYKANLLRESTEAREARGLAPLPMGENGGIEMEVNWMAKAEHEYIPNFKVLQAAFDRLDIARNIPVDQLIRGKYQDNLEFLQWLKCYWEKEGGAGHRDYDAVSVRQDKTLPQWAKPLGLFRPRAAVPRVERRGEKENQKPRMPKDEAQRNRVPGARVAVKTPRSMHGVTPALRAPEEFRGEDEVVTLKKDKKVCFQDECWQAMKGQLEEQKEDDATNDRFWVSKRPPPPLSLAAQPDTFYATGRRFAPMARDGPGAQESRLRPGRSGRAGVELVQAGNHG